jgi:hypothetical protein
MSLRNYKELKAILNMEELIVFTLNLLADKLMGPKEKRVGVFGPYELMDRTLILKVMKIVWKKGFVAFSGIGYYKPNDSKLYPIDPFKSNFIYWFFKIISSPLRYWHIFPSIGSKAVFNLSLLRTNIIELEGCVEYRIPILGFVLRDTIYKENPLENCEYLRLNKNYSECVAPDISFCRFTRFCPFTSLPIMLPEAIREVFIKKYDPKNRLIAVRELKYLDIPISEFLR